MSDSQLTVQNDLKLPGSTMLLALSGWMDGGFVSTGTIRNLMRDRKLTPVAQIDGDGFYIDSFPGSMELASLLRPHVRYVDGVIEEFDIQSNEVFADVEQNIVFFLGREPNMNWRAFADCIFDVVKRMQVGRIVFVGSFGGSVPHTREPRIYGSVSDASLKPLLKQWNVRPTEYEGPASFATFVLSQAASHRVEMLSIAVEIPNYLEGTNPISIESVSRRISSKMNVQVDLDELRKSSIEWETQVTDAVSKDKSLARKIRKLEDEYDNDLVDSLGIKEG